VNPRRKYEGLRDVKFLLREVEKIPENESRDSGGSFPESMSLWSVRDMHCRFFSYSVKIRTIKEETGGVNLAGKAPYA